MSSNETQDAFAALGGRFDPATLSAVGPYQGVRYFAEGGMAFVYEARHPQFPEKRLAVKLMKPEVAGIAMMRDRFLREAQLLARIGHPHLVSIHSFGVDEHTRCPYFAMDYIDGGNLAEKLEADGPFSVEAAGELYDRVLGALAALHREGIVHRDIKPLNIFLWRSGEPMLADLGIARDTAGAATTAFFVGSPKWASPEQANGLRIDVRSDIFSLGVSLFETLVGYHPYEDAKNVDTSSASSLIGMLAEHLRHKKPIPLEFPREIPKALRGVIRKACEIQPDKRFANADEMRRALRNAVREEPAGGEGWLSERIGSALDWLRAHGLRAGLGAGAVAALAALVAGGYVGWSKLQEQKAEEVVARARRAVSAVAPEDRSLGDRLRAADAEIERDRPEAAIGLAEAVCNDLVQRIGAALEPAVRDSVGALRRAKFAVQQAGVGGAAWEQLDGLARDEARRAPRAGGEVACDAPRRLEEYSRALRDSALALDSALQAPDLKGKVTALRDRAHRPELAPSIDEKVLADADRKLAAGELPEAFELYTRAELSARAGELSRQYASRLRDVAAAPEFAERRPQVSSALARVVKLGSLSDVDALAAEIEPAAKDAAGALDAVRGDVTAALAAGDQALTRARESGVSKAGLERGETQLASAREDLAQERFAAAFGTAKGASEDLDRLAKRVTEGGAAAKDARLTASAKREAAVAAGAGERTLAKGDELMAKAEKLVQDGSPADAAEMYASAEAEFGSAQKASVAAATKIAKLVRDRAAAAKQRAGELGATGADFAAGDEAEQRGETALASGEMIAAQQHFGAARDAYHRAPVRSADERAAQARTAAVDVGATESSLAGGDATLTEARSRSAAEPDEALRLYAAAEIIFTGARNERIALAEKAKAKALKAQDEAKGAREKASAAKLADTELADGDRELALGDDFLAKGKTEAAEERYSAARVAYQRAPLRGAEASVARAREDALGAGARETALAKGDASLRKARDAKRPEDALRLYGDAEAAYASARSDAVALTDKVKAGALAAQSGARAARQTAQGADVGEAALADGDSELGLGDRALEDNDLDAARQHFAAASAAFQRAPLRSAEERATRAREDAVSAGAKPGSLTKPDAELKKARAAKKPEDALRLFGSAETAFTAARTDAVAATDKLKAGALQAQSDARAARATAQAAKPAAGALDAGDRELERGDAALGSGQHAAASEHFTTAAKAYRGVAKGGAEELESARGVRALAARAQGAAVRAQATEPDLRAGRAALDEGDAALAKEDAANASERFSAARGLFDEAEKAARARKESGAGQSKALDAQRKAVKAGADEEELRAGRDALRAGEAARENDPARALASYGEASALFAEAERGARARAGASNAAATAKKARAIAVAKGADAATLAAGDAAVSRGEAALATRDYPAAQQAFSSAEATFRAYKPPAAPPPESITLKPPDTAAAPAPTTIPASPDPDPRAIAQAALDQYASAYEARDIERLNAAWRMNANQRERTETLFKQVSEVKVDIGRLTPQRDGERVVVDFDQRIDAGGRDSGPVRMRAVLQQSAGRWTIVELGKGQ